jgi:hypothetical protein
MAARYIRFVTDAIDPQSHVRRGILDVAHNLCDHGDMRPEERAVLEGLLRWFDKSLEVPERFCRQTTKVHRRPARAISWFRDSAGEHIGRARKVAAILEGHGVCVHMTTTERPGYIIYEDPHQVAAEPFADTQT